MTRLAATTAGRMAKASVAESLEKKSPFSFGLSDFPVAAIYLFGNRESGLGLHPCHPSEEISRYVHVWDAQGGHIYQQIIPSEPGMR
jgi:hypothetical protein